MLDSGYHYRLGQKNNHVIGLHCRAQPSNCVEQDSPAVLDILAKEGSTGDGPVHGHVILGLTVGRGR